MRGVSHQENTARFITIGFAVIIIEPSGKSRNDFLVVSVTKINHWLFLRLRLDQYGRKLKTDCMEEVMRPVLSAFLTMMNNIVYKALFYKDNCL